MDVVRIACVTPPDADRSRWSRELLLEAIAAGLSPLAVPLDGLTSFTATLPPHLAGALKTLAAQHRWSVPQTAAGLIEAARKARDSAPAAPVSGDTRALDLDELRAELHPLFKGCTEAIAAGKIAFAEAATGTGKGRMIALLATQAASAGQRTVICAPLPILWQLAETLTRFEPCRTAGVAILLGRSNFVSPELLRDWAVEQEHAPLLEWIEAGGTPRDARTLALQQLLGLPLNWLLDEALSLADDLEPGDVILSHDDEIDDCEGEAIYQALQARSASAGIVLCSHHMLAADIHRQLVWGARKRNAAEKSGEEKSSGGDTRLPEQIDLLLVDEAHQLEQAFSAIFSLSLYLKPLARQIEHSTARGRRGVLDAISALSQEILRLATNGKNSVTGPADEFPVAKLRVQQLLLALEGLSLNRRAKALRQVIRHAKRTLDDFMSGYGTVRLEVSPVRYYGQLQVSRANLQLPLEHLWGRCRAAALVSATLYSDGVNGGLTRWKLGVPKERASFLAAVVPAWVIDPVQVMLPAADDPLPDDSPEWLDFQAGKIRSISHAAAGGTLVLCTSYANAAGITARLADLGERLVAQSHGTSASLCASQFRHLYAAGQRPVWVGVGSAWTGIDLHDPNAQPEEDRMLTDLVVTRLPLGANRTLTHERRVSIAGFGIVSQEAVWQLRQGIGRLVRRQGVSQRQLWLLDPRIVLREPWTTSFRTALARYRQMPSPL